MSADFLRTVLPPTGLYHVLGLTWENNHVTKRTPVFEETVDNVDVRAKLLDGNGVDVYFALASFNDPAEGRKASNAKELRSFFVDIDCGEGKGYPTQEAALVGLDAFLDKFALPAPWVVNSGRGLHVYWPFTEPVSALDWKYRAMQFKAFVAEHLTIDPTASADAARVLRVPGTTNRKGSPLPVVVVREGVSTPFDELVTQLRLRTPTPVEVPDVPASMTQLLAAAKEHGPDAITSKVAGEDFPPCSFKRVVERSLKGAGCAQIAHAVTQAHTLEEPLWRAALAVAWRCTDAEQAIHKLSEPHPDYTPEDTLAKAERTSGPTTCKWYKDNYPKRCEGCAHNISSPIMLGKKVEAAPAVDGVYQIVSAQRDATNAPVVHHVPAYPWPYFRPATGGVARYETDKDGNKFEVQIYPYDLYINDRFYDIDDQDQGEGELVRLVIHTPQDGVRRVLLPVTQLLVRDKLRDTLLKHGVIVLDKAVSDIMSYFAATIRSIQKAHAAERTRQQMGWTPDFGGFVIGELEYRPNQTVLAPAGSNTRALAPMMRPCGSIEEWVKIANFYNQPGMEPHAATVLLGFAAPLLRLMGGIDVRGATINLISTKSGTGKTTAQMIVNSIFGHPAQLLLKKQDTLASKMQMLGMLNNIAVTMDEITNMTDEEVSELIYSVPEGRGKHRMESQYNRLRTNHTTWNTFVITSANASLYDKLNRLKATADGEIRRLIEIPFARPLSIPKATSDKLFSNLSSNYGLAGPVYVQHIMRNLQAVQDTIFVEQRRLDSELEFDQSDRFYSNVLTLASTAGKLARGLGLLSYDVDNLIAYLSNTIRNIKHDVVAPVLDSGSTVFEALAAYINLNINNALVISSPKNGVPSAGTILPKGALRMRYEPDTKELWIPVVDFRTFLVDRQIDVRHAVRELATRGVLKASDGMVSGTTKRLAAGTAMATPPMRCYCFDGNLLEISVDAFSQANASNNP